MRILKKIASYILIAISIILLLSIIFFFDNKERYINDVSSIPNTEESEVIDNRFKSWKEEYENNLTKSSSYAGEIKFESGLIEEPFVKVKDNDEYLRKNWLTNEYDTLGTVFMDYECDFNSSNIILYGHYVYPEYDAGFDESGNRINNDTLMFTPLKKLIDSNNYEDNKYIYLVVNSEVRKYLISSVYEVDLLQDEAGIIYPDESLLYYLPEYDKDYFEFYIKMSRKKNITIQAPH